MPTQNYLLKTSVISDVIFDYWMIRGGNRYSLILKVNEKVGLRSVSALTAAMTGASSLRSTSLSALARPLTSLVLTLIFHLLLRLVRTVDDVGSLLYLP